MAKSRHSISAAQSERWQAAQVRRQRWDRIWSIVIIAILVGIVVLVLAIQISHHV